MLKLRNFLWAFSAMALCVVVAERLTDESGRDGENGVAATHGGTLPAASSIDLPPNWRVDAVGRESGGWRQIGVAPLCFEAAKEEVSAIMRECGYKKDDLVSESAGGRSSVLVRYTAAGAPTVMWMLWEAGNFSTGFSWGREKE